MLNPTPRGTEVRVRISHEGTTFTALERVAHSCAFFKGAAFGIDSSHPFSFVLLARSPANDSIHSFYFSLDK